MEILQTIWTALTTENEFLTRIFIVPLSLLEAYLSMLISTTLLALTPNNKQKILYVFTITILGNIVNFLLPSPYNTYINLTIILISIMVFLKANIFQAIIAFIFPSIITAFIESILAKVYFSIFEIDYLVGGTIPLHRIIGTLIVYSFMYLIYILIKYLKLNISKIQILDTRKKALLIINMIFALVLISMQIYVTYFYSSVLPFYIVLLSLFSLLTYVIISLYTTFTVSKLETTSINLEEAQLYNKTLEILQDNTRAFRHDFSNILQGMVGYIDNNDMEGLRNYYSQLVEDVQHSNNLTTLSPKVVNNPAIYNVLATKYHKADSLGIKIHLEAFLDMNDLHMKIYEFTRVLGILMDNAIEATSECENKIINVTFRKDSRRNMQLLIIENTYKDKDINTDKIFEKGFSTKKGNTGLGLWEVRQILKKNNNLNLFTTKTDEFFIQQFEIFY